MIGDVLIVGPVQDILGGGHHILRGEGRSVREGDGGAKIEGPGSPVGGALPALGQLALGHIIVIDVDQAFVYQIIEGEHIPFQRKQGTHRQRLGGLNADDQAVLHVGGQGTVSAEQKHQRQHQGEGLRNTVSDRCHRL